MNLYVRNDICPTFLPYGPGSRTSPEFQKLLGIAMEMFLLCSDDSESDVRMVADECLNKIIKVSTERRPTLVFSLHFSTLSVIVSSITLINNYLQLVPTEETIQ